MLNYELINFQTLGDERGSLVALEMGKEIPFNIQRVYYIYNTKKEVARGFHAHKALKQVAICVSGSCCFVLDDGVQKQEVTLNSPSKGLLINIMIWHEMYNFSDDCVLLLLASERYDESDYIRNYQEFLELGRSGKN
jgi:dTDP-4-dehydrorhamnose 3,5-epimerase-like enzyme